MGWYVTCSLCGKTEKHGIGCNCYDEEFKTNLARMKGAVILDVVTLDDGSRILYKLQKSEKVFYLCMNLSQGGEYASYRRLHEVSESDLERGVTEVEEEEKVIVRFVETPSDEELFEQCLKKEEEEEEGGEEGEDSEDGGEDSEDDEEEKMCLSLEKDQVFPHCQVVAKNEIYFFLIDQDVTSSYFDIVMPKEDDNAHLKQGDIVAVKVTGINIADDGTPGAFVQLVKP